MEVFDDAASHRSLDRLDLRSELPYALERDQLQLRYQPVRPGRGRDDERQPVRRTAYSSLSYLRRFPIECLKIDRSFVGGATGRDLDVSIVRAVLAIAESMDLSAVAEGVETTRQRAALLRLGCRSGQGYLLSRPLTPARATEFLRSRAAA